MVKKFSDLVKRIRTETNLSQSEFANALSVSSVYISKIETEQKSASKQFIEKLADFLDIHPSAMAQFLFLGDSSHKKDLSRIEMTLIGLGEELQNTLITKKIKNGSFDKYKSAQQKTPCKSNFV